MKKVSRQREWQKRQRELGNCVICGRTARLTRRRNASTVRGSRCEEHQALANKYQNRRNQRKRQSAASVTGD